jgi:hypothetical protein
MGVKYAVVFEQAENNWASYVPDLPGCITCPLAKTSITYCPLGTRRSIRSGWFSTTYK